MASERNRLLIPEDFIETGSTGIGNFIQRPDLKYNRPVICNTNTSTHINESFETRASVVKDDNITVTDNCLLKCLNPSNVICNKCFNFKSSVNVSVKEETRLTSDFPPVTLISKLKPFSVGFDDGTFNAKMCFSISKENELDTGTVKTQPVTLKKPHLLTPDSFIISPKSLDSSTLPDIPRVPDTLFEAQDSVNKLSISTNNIEISSHPQSKFLFVSPSNKRSEVKLGDIKSSLIKEHQLLEDELNKEAALSNPNGIYDEDDDINSLSVRRKLQFDTPSENERLKTAREKSFIKNERINTVRDRPTGFLENERIETAGDSFRGNESLKPARDKFLNNERINTVRDRGYLENERTETARDSFHGNERINTAREKYFAGFQCSLKIPDNIYDNFSLEEKDNGVSSKFSFTRNPFPPIGVFWDIENCRIPKGLSATHVVQAIRNRFFDGYKEAEFICVCDTLKENPKVLEELNDAQVNIMHVGSIVKNAADDKLLQSMRRFADIHGAGSSIILISGDSDFATELYDLRYRKKLHVILVHNAHAQDSLKLSAHETALFSDVTQELPQRNLKNKCSSLSKEVMVWNMPNNVDQNLIRRRLHILASNCGGKYIQVQRNSAKIAFNTPELAARAKKRIDGESVYGSKVFCTFGKLNDRNDRGSRVRQLDPVFVQRAEYSSTRESERKYPFLPESTEFDMDFSNKSFWNKSSESSNSNMNDSYCTSWRMPSPAQNMNGHSFNSSPAFNSSSQSNSSRENSPSFFINRNGNGDSFNPSSQLLPPSKECQTQNYVDDFPYPSQGYNTRSVWPPENRNGTFPSSNQLSNPLPSFSNLSMKESSQESIASVSSVPVELLITNLDQNIDAREMKKVLLAWFRERVMVLHVSMFLQSDGYLAATVTVPSQHDAQFAISQLHRKRIGTKRIVISYINHHQQPPQLKRSKVLNLLKEIPGKRLPLFKFRELYERRYQETIGVSELYNMKSIITVCDNLTGRTVCLNSDSGHALDKASMQDPDQLKYCQLHSRGHDTSVGWAERDHSAILPSVRLSLKDVGHAIHILLESHNGSVPLASLVDCYCEEVGSLVEDPTGVPLEHLISCLSGINIVTDMFGFKHVRRLEGKLSQHDPEELTRYVSPPLVGHLSLFSRELVDLLKTFPHCRMLLTRFIPNYHNHFGRQCRIADYGYTKLTDLLASLGHLIQIMGEGTKKTLTLSHRVQVKRFSSDLLRVLKGQPSKTIALEAFPDAFLKTMGKTWDVTDYGVCDIMDMLREIQETTIVLNTDNGVTISIPRREQTAEEIERTRLFATEIIELLRHSPQCKMQFNRFVPAYHHHFGRQCRVADYGFNKLIELFETIPSVVQILEDEEGEKMLQLVDKERLRILGDQVYTLVKNSPKQMISLSALSTVFMHYYGYSLKPDHYDCQDVEELIGKLRNHVKVEEKEKEQKITLVDRSSINELWLKTRKLLWDEPSCSLPMKKFVDVFTKKYNQALDIEVLKNDLQEYLQFKENGEDCLIQLVPLQVFARDLLIMLSEAGGRMLLMNFECAYLNRFGVACRPASYGFPNLTVLMQNIGDMVHLKGKKMKRIIALNKTKVPDLPNYCPPPPAQPQTGVKEKISKYGVPYMPVPPPPQNSFTQAQRGPPPPATPPCDQRTYSKDVVGSRVVMGLTPPPQQTYHPPHSPVLYSGSPVATGGSVVWGQVWSPQYSVMPQLSPAHYMVPTVPMNWNNMPLSSVAPGSKPAEGGAVCRRKNPVSIKTLEEIEKGLPPNASELPSPELLTQNEDVASDSTLK